MNDIIIPDATCVLQMHSSVYNEHFRFYSKNVGTVEEKEWLPSGSKPRPEVLRVRLRRVPTGPTRLFYAEI